MLGVSTGTLPVSVCLLPVPVSTLSCTPFHRSPTINSQRFALFDSTFSVRFKLISHSLSAPFPLPLRSAEDVPTCRVCVCRRLPPAAVMAPGACLNSWLWGRVCAGEAREGLEGVLRVRATLKVHRSNAEVPRVEGGGPWPGPARPARPGPAWPRPATRASLQRGTRARGTLQPGRGPRRGPRSMRGTRAWGTLQPSRPGFRPGPGAAAVAAGSAGARGRCHGPAPWSLHCTGEREQRALDN